MATDSRTSKKLPKAVLSPKPVELTALSSATAPRAVTPARTKESKPVGVSVNRNSSFSAQNLISGYADEIKDVLPNVKVTEILPFGNDKFDDKSEDDSLSGRSSKSPEGLDVRRRYQKASPRGSPINGRDSVSPNQRHLNLPSNENIASTVKSYSSPRRKLPLVPHKKSPVMQMTNGKVNTSAEQKLVKSALNSDRPHRRSQHRPREGTPVANDDSSQESSPFDKSEESDLSVSASDSVLEILDKVDRNESFNSTNHENSQGMLDMSVKSGYELDELSDIKMEIIPQSSGTENLDVVSLNGAESMSSIPNQNDDLKADSKNVSAFNSEETEENGFISSECFTNLRDSSRSRSPDKIKTEKSTEAKSKPKQNSEDTTNGTNSVKVETRSVPDSDRKITRTPSYRKRIMAKARSRYRKQQEFCRCVVPSAETEDGLCPHCNLSKGQGQSAGSEIPRSQTSLGIAQRLNDTEDLNDSQSNQLRSFTPGLPPLPGNTYDSYVSPLRNKNLKRVPVSSRVEVLMSNDLFKKHLSRHEHILQKHTLSYKRFGMKKAVSNLDLSEACLYDNEEIEGVGWNRLTVQESGSEDSCAEKLCGDNLDSQKTDIENGILGRRRSRRFSLTGEEDVSMETFQEKQNEENKILEKQEKDFHARQPLPSFKEFCAKQLPNRPQIPSFSEYRQSRRRRTSQTRTKPEGTTARRVLPEPLEKSLENKKSEISPEKIHEQATDFVLQPDLEPIEEIDSKESKVTNEASENKADETVSIGNKPNAADSFLTESKSETEKEGTVVADVLCDPVEKKNETGLEQMENDKEKGLNPGKLETDENDISLITLTSSQPVIESVEEIVKSESENVLKNSSADVTKPRRKLPSDSCIQDIQESSDESSSQSSLMAPSQRIRERKRKGSKRPRSLISRKSSLRGLLDGLHEKELAKESKGNYSPRSDTGVVLSRSYRTKLHRDATSTNQLHSNQFSQSLDLENNTFADELRASTGSRHIKLTYEGDNCDGNSLRGGDSFGNSLLVSKGSNSERDSPQSSVSGRILMSTEQDSDSKKGSAKGNNSTSLDKDAASQKSESNRSVSTASVAGSTLSIAESISSEIVDADGISQLFSDDATDSCLAVRKLSKDDISQVFRSTSDACDATPEAIRKRKERRERPYKSDPFSGSEIIPASKRILLREERARLRLPKSFATSSKEEILSFLGDVCHGDKLGRHDSFPSLEELNEDDEQTPSVTDVHSERDRRVRNRLSNVSTTSTDSGVIGQDGSHDSHQESPNSTLSGTVPVNRSFTGVRSHVTRQLSSSCSDLSNRQMLDCLDCCAIQRSDLQSMLQICPRCCRRRVERKKIIQEILDTEVNYGRDLTILKEEFYIPMKTAGLLKQDQLDSIFLNLDELIHVHGQFITKLRSSVQGANQHCDEDLHNVNIGSLFLESSTMFLTFENYCVNQSQAPILLEQLEKEKELLRIFLHVSQNDNHLLRRMHLKSFLMVPVQRIMKYPMLLDRLYKVTPSQHADKDAIKEAKDKIEDILGHINAKTKGAHLKLQKRKSSERHYSVTEKMEVSRVALEILGWNRKDVCDLITSRLQLTQPVDHTWAAKKCKNLKFTTVHAVLLTLGEPDFERQDDGNLVFPRSTPVRQAAVVLIREKNGKYQAFREPFMLEKCVVSQDPDYLEVFEILEWNREPYLLKGDSHAETQLWVQNLRQQTSDLGFWRKRRNAMPNILLSHLAP